MTSFYPLRFRPVYRDYLWGGRRFATSLGRTLQPGRTYAESWELADHPDGQSVVAAGPMTGLTLGQLVRRHGAELLGRHHPQKRFPLLLKYLDAQRRLSLQVHPTDRLAAEMGLSDPGKTEAWVVLEADPGSRIWAGFRQPVDRARVEAALADGVLPELLHTFQPAPGDCLLLPAGTVHALGAGLLVAEIQQTSNNTFRLFDWNRLGPDGNPRPLHIAQGLAAIDYHQGPVSPRPPRATETPGLQRLVDCDKFVLNRCRLAGEIELGGDNRLRILTVIEGSLQVVGDPSPQPLGRGGTVLLPAACGPVALRPLAGPNPVLLQAHLP